MKILIIDDDKKLLGLLTEFLPKYQIESDTADSGETGLKLLKTGEFDLVVLDVLMPGMDGFSVCREIRKFSTVPIIMLSARGDATDKIIGLEIGADDYMAKPFNPRELVTRIQTILRRSSAQPAAQKLKFGNLEIDFAGREALLSDKPVNLTTMEYEVLALLARNPGRKFSRDEIMDAVQGFDSGSYSRAIDILISRLRSKLGEKARNPVYIKSVHAFGYVFVGKSL